MELADFQEITEKTWAYLTIKQLLNRAKGEVNKTAVDAVKTRAKELSLKYGFVTPLTSMVVTKPEVDPDKRKPPPAKDVSESDVNKDPDTSVRAAGPKPPSNSASVPSPRGSAGRSNFMTDNDPNFIVNVKSIDDAICFDVMGQEGDVYNLVTDVYSGLTVDAKVVANKMVVNGASKPHNTDQGEIKTFLGEISIRRRRFELTITPTNITVMGETVKWKKGATMSHGTTKVVVDQAGIMVLVNFDDGITFAIMRHLKSRPLRRKGKVNFLGMYIVEHKGLSYHTHGLLGHFIHRIVTLEKTKRSIKEKLMGRLRVSGNTQRHRNVMATLGHRLNLAINETVSCWMVQHNGGALLDGKITDYLIK